MKGSFYFGCGKKIRGLGFKISFENPVIAGQDYNLFEFAFLWFSCWITFEKKDKRPF